MDAGEKSILVFTHEQWASESPRDVAGVICLWIASISIAHLLVVVSSLTLFAGDVIIPRNAVDVQ